MKTVIKHKKVLIGIAIVLFSSLFASWPLFLKGYIPTHDGEYHIIRFIEFFRMITAGYFFPRWAPNLNSGYGIPIFIFHYPLPNYVGAFFQMAGLHAVDAFKWSMALGYIAAGIFSFLWLRRIFGVTAGMVGAIVASFVPYWFVDIYVRGSVGEVWALGFLFISLMLIEYRLIIPLSFAVAGLILSHNILAMLFIPFLVGYALLRNKRCIKSIIYGILLTAYFWIPALIESSFVVGLNTVNFREHFVALYELIVPMWGTDISGGTFGTNKMSFQIGIIPIVIILGSVFFAFRERNKGLQKLFGYFIFVCLVAILLMLSMASLIWNTVPFLSFVQYPWRFLSFMIPVTAFLGAYVSYHVRKKVWLIILMILSASLVYSYMRPVVYEPRDDVYYLSRKNFMDGTSSMGNSFSTIWTGWKKERPPYVLEVINGKVPGGMHDYSYLRKRFSVVSDIDSEVIIPIIYYPGWKVFVDEKEYPINYFSDGIIRFPLPEGKHKVVVQFTETAIRKSANLLSIITLVWLLGWGILGIYANRTGHLSH